MSNINRLVKHSNSYRPRAEVYIIKDNKYLIVGIPPKWNGYTIPGGGMDPGEIPEETAKREALEEIGTKCKNLKKIDSIKIAHTNNIRTEYTGSLFHTFVADFDGYDNSLQSDDLTDKYSPKEVTFKDAISFFKKHQENCVKANDLFNASKAKYVLKILEKIKNAS